MITIRESSYNDVFSSCSLIVDWFDNTSEKDYRITRALQEIPEDSIYHEVYGGKDIKGKETHSHVTVAVGLIEKEMWKCREAIESIKRVYPPKFVIGKINFFRGAAPYDVMYLEIISGFLITINDTLRKELEEINVLYSYKPHLCLAYVLKGAYKNWKGKSISGLTGEIVQIHSIDFILPNKQKFEIKV